MYFIRRFERDPHKALDTLQDIWLTVWKTIGSLQKPEAFRTWIYRIAHGAVVSSIRAEQRRRELEHHPSRPPPRLPSALPALDAADLLHYALEQLSPEHREVVTLRFLEDMTIDEISAATDCPCGTVKSRLHYAKQAIQQLIEEQIYGK